MAFGTVVTTAGGQGNLLRVENISENAGSAWELGMILVFELGEGITSVEKGLIYKISAASSNPATIDCTITSSSAGLKATGRLRANKTQLQIDTGQWGDNVKQHLLKNVHIAIAPSFTIAMRGTIPAGYEEAPALTDVEVGTLFTCAIVYQGNQNPAWVDFLDEVPPNNNN